MISSVLEQIQIPGSVIFQPLLQTQ